MTKRVLFQALALLIIWYSFMQTSSAQERIKISYSAVDSCNSVWYVTQEKGFFKKARTGGGYRGIDPSATAGRLAPLECKLT